MLLINSRLLGSLGLLTAFLVFSKVEVRPPRVIRQREAISQLLRIRIVSKKRVHVRLH